MSDEVAKEKINSMEKKIDGKMKSVASIPANYVSILQLQERWVKEKERKQKEKDLVERRVERRVKEQVNGQRRRERMKVVVEAIEPRVKPERKGLGGDFRMNRLEKEPNCVEKEEVEVSATVSKKDEDGGHSRERKKKWCKKENKNQGGSVEEVVKSESKAYIPRENNLVKEEISTEKIVQNRENAAASDSISVETQFQDLWIKKRVEEEARDREVKGPARLNRGQVHSRNQKRDRSSTRVVRATGPMVWVKKGKNDGAGGGNGV